MWPVLAVNFVFLTVLLFCFSLLVVLVGLIFGSYILNCFVCFLFYNVSVISESLGFVYIEIIYLSFCFFPTVPLSCLAVI